MKRLSALLLAAAVILSCGLSLADDPDPIVGVWYVNLVVSDGVPVGNPGDVRYVALFTFEEDGTITYFEIDFNLFGHSSTGSLPVNGGRWTRSGDGYSVSYVGMGTNPAYLEGDELWAITLTPNVYYRMHRMAAADWFSDIVNAQFIQYSIR